MLRGAWFSPILSRNSKAASKQQVRTDWQSASGLGSCSSWLHSNPLQKFDNFFPNLSFIFLQFDNIFQLDIFLDIFGNSDKSNHFDIILLDLDIFDNFLHMGAILEKFVIL